MAKEIIIDPPGFTFQEFSLLTGLTKKDCTITNINLETRLADNLVLKIPMLSAAMTSVTGYEMALALAKEGGLGVLPVKLGHEEQARIVNAIKHYEMGFVTKPITANEESTIDDVLKLIEKHGHSKVPVVDRNNGCLGVFSYQDYLKAPISRDELVTKAMSLIQNVPHINRPELTIGEAKVLLEKENASYLVVLDDLQRLDRLAFKKDEDKLKVGVAISTHEGWEKAVDACLAEDPDVFSIDTSDGFNDYTAEVIKNYILKKTGKPICGGNIITYDGAMYLMEAGADIIKSGMSSGSICTTKREKAVGRAPMTALIEADQARRDYFKKTGRYVTLIADGGISNAADVIIALTIADGVMMGGYFNKFFEAAAPKLDANGKPTKQEGDMVEVEIWGEGSIRAQNLQRYDQQPYTYFPEGEEGTVPYAGRLKPSLKKDLLKIRAAMVNAGCHDLPEFRKEAVIERMSPYAQAIVGDTHNIKVKG